MKLENLIMIDITYTSLTAAPRIYKTNKIKTNWRPCIFLFPLFGKKKYFKEILNKV